MEDTGPDEGRILIAALGGTIAMTSASGGATPTETADSLAEAVPELAERAVVSTETFANVPSASLGIGTVLELGVQLQRACSEGTTGVVVTQGTDTMEETAYLLDLVWPLPQPVVFTGAMRPADALSADGPANLLSAVTVAAAAEASGRGAMVVMNDEVHAPRWLRKVHSTSLDAFASCGSGPVARVSEGRVTFHQATGARRWLAVDPSHAVPHVGLVRLALGEPPTVLESLSSACDGLVVEGFGGGHVPSSWVEPLRKVASDKPVVLASRTGGPILTRTYDFSGAETGLLRMGLVPGGELDGLKARILLICCIMAGDHGRTVTELFREFATAQTGEFRNRTDGRMGP